MSPAELLGALPWQVRRSVERWLPDTATDMVMGPVIRTIATGPAILHTAAIPRTATGPTIRHTATGTVIRPTLHTLTIVHGVCDGGGNRFNADVPDVVN